MEFWKVYDELSYKYPLYMKLEHLRGGITRWRVQVFGKYMAKDAGDALIITAEAQSREEVFKKAAEKLQNRTADIKEMAETPMSKKVFAEMGMQ